MSQLTFDFEVDAPEWAPIYKAGFGALGWRHARNGMPIHEDGTKVTESEWRAYLASIFICRDCGAKTAGSPGGAGREGSYSLCEPCAAIDGCTVRPHEIVREERPWDSNSEVTELAHCVHDSWFLLEFDREELEESIASHLAIRHTSRWGKGSHPPEEHDGLVAAREKRRARYLASAKGVAA